ncbi:MAG: hypothetical protein JNG84_13320 [Archangium sp.]|nr:hypothetical protein [Archangium sp.]
MPPPVDPSPQPKRPPSPDPDAGPTPEALRAAGVVETGAHGHEALAAQLWAWRWRVTGVVAALVLVKGIGGCIDFSSTETEKKGRALGVGLQQSAAEAVQARVAAVRAESGNQASAPVQPVPLLPSPLRTAMMTALTEADASVSQGDAVAFQRRCPVAARSLKAYAPTAPSLLQQSALSSLSVELAAMCSMRFNSVPTDPWRSISQRIFKALNEE